MKTNRKISTLFLIFAFLAAALAGPARAGQTAPPAEKAAEAAQAQAASGNAQTQTQQERMLKAQEDQLKRIEAERKKAEEEKYMMEGIVKTYSLKYVNPNDLMKAAKFYVYEFTASGGTLTVRIPRKNVADFEAVLKKLDVEKKNIQLQVYTIVAAKDSPPEHYKANFVTETRDVGNADLKRVLDEMKGLWNFKYYWVDNPSFITVKDGSAGNTSKLVSSLDFEMHIRNVELRGGEPGKRIIAAGGISLSQTAYNAAGSLERSSLIETSDITFKEKGYLVVGVSGFRSGSWTGAALILVISAEVK